MSLLARRYATALFEVAESRGETAKVLDDVERLHALFGSAEGRAFLADPGNVRRELDAVLQRVLEDSSELTRNTVAVIRQRRREGILPELAAELRAMVQRRAGEAVAVVATARALSADEQAGLREQLARLTRTRIVLDVRVDPELLGGVRVRVGNTLYDGSLAGELDALRQRLLHVPVPRT